MGSGPLSSWPAIYAALARCRMEGIMNIGSSFVVPAILTALAPFSVACGAATDTQPEQVSATEQAVVTAGPGFEAAFQGSGGTLWESGNPTKDTGGAMMKGTSPSIAGLANGAGFEVTFQSDKGYLWITGNAGVGNTWYGMDQTSNPSITGLPGGSYQIAFQANTHNLWVTGAMGSGDQGLPMAPGTSPAITALGSSWEVAFHHANGNLWFTGNTGTFDTGYPMAPNTSPTLISLNPSYEGFEAAFQHGNGNLWIYGTESIQDLSYAMMPNSSPSIAKIPADSYGIEHFKIAFANAADHNHLWTTGGNLGIGSNTIGSTYVVAAGTSPSIAVTAKGAWEVAFQSGSYHLWYLGSQVIADTNGIMKAGTSPSIAAL